MDFIGVMVILVDDKEFGWTPKKMDVTESIQLSHERNLRCNPMFITIININVTF